MKHTIPVLLVLAAMASLAPAQYVETTIPVPQSPEVLQWNRTNNRVYCAVGYPDAFGAVAVLDGATNVMLDSILLRCQMPGGLAIDTAANRVFCVGSSFYPLDDSLVTVIAAANDSILAKIGVGSGPLAICYNPQNNKVYTASQLTDTAYVIGCNPYAIRAKLGVHSNPYCMVYVPDVNRVYCANRGFYGSADYRISVIDGATDSIAGEINVGSFPVALCYNSTDHKLYSANNWDDNVTIIDVMADSVLATVHVSASPYNLCWNPANDRVYCGSSENGTVTVIDGVTNSAVGSISLSGPTWAIVADSAVNKVYASNYTIDRVTVINGATNSIIAALSVGTGPRALCQNPASGRVYVGNREGHSVTVIRDSMSGGVEEVTKGKVEVTSPGPTIVRGVLRVQSTIDDFRSPIDLLDASGRRVLTRTLEPSTPGILSVDVSRLVPGVYFVRQASSVSKVVIAR
jgi:YVTN family beta-propeller protein